MSKFRVGTGASNYSPSKPRLVGRGVRQAKAQTLDEEQAEEVRAYLLVVVCACVRGLGLISEKKNLKEKVNSLLGCRF